MVYMLLVFLALAGILGYKVISAVPTLLHTPLMSGMNALSGITVIGALAVYASAAPESKIWAATALLLAMINVAGGFYVTERMLRMFRNSREAQ